MGYVVVYELNGLIHIMTLTAADWIDAYGEWLTRRPVGSLLRCLTESDGVGFDSVYLEKTGEYVLKMIVVPRVKS